jgi:hypothetical protein
MKKDGVNYFPGKTTFVFRHRYKTWRLYRMSRVKSFAWAVKYRKLYTWYLPENWPKQTIDYPPTVY